MDPRKPIRVLLVVSLLGVPAATGQIAFPCSGVGAIPDSVGGCGNPPATPLDVICDVSGVVGTLLDVDVDITLSHTWVADLEMTLIAPGATASLLTVGRIGATTATACGDSSDWGGTYTFDDESTNLNIWTEATNQGATSPLTPQSYRTTEGGGAGQTNPAPFTSLAAAFGGMTAADVNGAWTFQIYDISGGDTGSVTAANLTLWLDAMPFIDGFELGNTDAWSNTVP